MFECQYCETKFISEATMEKHVCRNRERMIELETPAGITAYKYYKLWFKKRKLPEHPPSSFIVSRYYNSFFKFREFVTEMSIPDVPLYIEFMSNERIIPQHWYNSDIYNYFMDYFDKDCSPKLHLRITLSNIDRLASTLGCELDAVFSHLHPVTVAEFIKSRNLSPWVMLLSVRFEEFLKTMVTEEERLLIESAIDIKRWKLIMDKNRNIIPDIKTYLTQVNL